MRFAVDEGIVLFPEGITEIPDCAFEKDDRIEILRVPEGVKRIGSRAFAGCGALTELHLPGKAPECVGEGAFDGCDSLPPENIPEEKIPFWVRYRQIPNQQVCVVEKKPGYFELAFPGNPGLEFAWDFCLCPGEVETLLEKALKQDCLVSDWMDYGGLRAKGEITEIGYQLPDMEKRECHYIRPRDLLEGLREWRKKIQKA